MKLQQLVETTNGHLIKEMQNAFCDQFIENVKTQLNKLESEINENPRFLRTTQWPESYDDVETGGTLLDPFKYTIFNALNGLKNHSLLVKFGITVPLSFNPRKLKTGSAAIDTSSKNLFIVYYPEHSFDVFVFNFINKLVTLKKPTKATFKKWARQVLEFANEISLEMVSDPTFKKFMVSMLHELTHASQASKNKVGALAGVNAFGNKLIDVYSNKIAKGILDRDYYAMFDEIDAYANGLSAELIQQADNKPIDLPSIEKAIKHPVYDLFGKISREPETDAAFKKVWSKFVRRVVQNINKYNEMLEK